MSDADVECPYCHDADKCGDYEGPACPICHGEGKISLYLIAAAPKMLVAMKEIDRIKDDTLGPRGGIQPLKSQEDFDRGCRMAFYRCAEIARAAIAKAEGKP